MYRLSSQLIADLEKEGKRQGLQPHTCNTLFYEIRIDGLSTIVFEILSVPNALVVEPVFADMAGSQVRDVGPTDPLHILYTNLSSDDAFHTFGIFEHLRTDLFLLKQLRPNNRPIDDEYARFKSRLYIRTKFSLIEACLSTVVLLIQKNNEWQEIIKSKKALKQFGPTVRGQLRDRTKHILRSFDKVYELHCPLDLNGSGWAGFERGIEIRKQITHPSSLQALAVNEENAILIADGWHWFAQQVVNLLQAYAAK